MPKIKKPEFFLILFLSVIAISFSLFQFYLFIRNTPSGTFSPYIHNYLQDYYYYLSYIKQGIDGRLLVTSKFSPDVFPSLFVYTFFPLIGLIGGIFHFSPILIYLIARLFCAVLLLVLGYILASFILKSVKSRMSAFLFMIIGVSFWYMDKGKILTYGDFWTGFDPFLRVAFLPHHIFANCMTVLAFIFLSLGIKKRKARYSLIGGIIAGIGVWVNTAIIFALVIGVLTAFILEIKNIIRNLPYVVLFLVFTLIPAFIIYMFINTVFPWTTFTAIESKRFYPMDYSFIGVLKIMGITGIFSIISIPIIIRRGDFLLKSVLGWFISPIIGLTLLQRYVPVSNIRYIQVAFYIPAAILSVYILSSALKINVIKRSIFLKVLFYTLLTCILLISTVPTFSSSIKEQLASVERNKYNPLIYVPSDFMDVLNWLDKNGNYDDVVMSDSVSSPLIPAFTNKRVIYGHPVMTYKVEERVSDIYGFYSLKSYEQSKNILIKDNVSYIIDWPKHPLLPSDFLSQIKAKKAYENNSYFIYKILGNQ
jgi:hypothetical protein